MCPLIIYVAQVTIVKKPQDIGTNIHLTTLFGIHKYNVLTVDN